MKARKYREQPPVVVFSAGLYKERAIAIGVIELNTRNTKNGLRIIAEWRRIEAAVPAGRRGEPLVEFYLGFAGEEADLRATLVDMICDTCLHLRNSGIDSDSHLTSVVDMVDEAALDFTAEASDEAAVARAVIAECAQHLHENDYSARDALWMSGVHVGIEVGPVPSSSPSP